MKTEIHSVIIRPLVTEKGTHQSETRNAYAFEVEATANKAQIRQAVEQLYNVKVDEVRTANRKGKPRRTKFRVGRTRHWKKAVVVLKDEYRIDLF
ncbi:MAG: 50S ribosomal protein L23 [Planctomycetaceae bacterium]|nr:50S ribosomal protein L23 [Planctomycetaceae bacterium]